MQKGDCIPLGKTTLRKFRKVPLEYHQTVSSIIVLRVLPSIEHTHFEKESIAKFYSTEYTIGSQSNRMGYRLEGARLAINDHKEIGFIRNCTRNDTDSIEWTTHNIAVRRADYRRLS